MKVLGRTDKGMVRETNQDNFIAKAFSDTHAFGLVCDGMGGAACGELASELAVNVIYEHVSSGFNENMSLDEARQLLVEAFEKANRHVYEFSSKNGERLEMGTTAIAVLAMADKVAAAYVGDSRIYLVSDQRVVQVSKDHSVVQAMVDTGEISEEEARRHPKRNIITRAIGTLETVEVDTSTLTLNYGESIVLCSDGLSEYVSPDEIAQQVSSCFEDSPKKLIDLANSRGGSDNITVVVISR